MIAKFFRFLFGYTYVTRKNPRSFNEVHKSNCKHAKALAKKRYMTQLSAYMLITKNDGKYNYDGCRYCMPEMNSEEISNSKK